MEKLFYLYFKVKTFFLKIYLNGKFYINRTFIIITIYLVKLFSFKNNKYFESIIKKSSNRKKNLKAIIVDGNNKKNPRTFSELAQRICGYYETKDISSNGLAAMFKQFTTPQNLENWLKKITGNQQLAFMGRYGEVPYIEQPYLKDITGKNLVTGVKEPHRGDNLLSAYDLTRVVSQIAWHRHIPPSDRLAFAQWHSLSALINAMGHDTARYVDVAIAALGMTYFMSDPVVISKMGFGYSDLRKRTELTYTACIQFVDHLATSQDVPTPKFRSINMTLRAVLDLQSPDREALEIDARMAAAVAEILRRVVTEELI